MSLVKYFLVTLIVLLFVGASGVAAQHQSGKPVFVLVHGAWHGGWCWQEVSWQLREKGFRAYTPTLSGLGEHKNVINEGINLQTHITDIINFIEMEDLHNVVLVGHSYAGTVIAGVADSIPGRLNKLVFLDAMIVHNGESPLSTQFKEVQTAMGKFVEKKQNIAPIIPAEEFGVTDKGKAKWVNERLTPQPFNTFAQKLTLKHAYGNNVPLVYISCTEKQLPIIKKMSGEARSNPLWTYLELNTGHDAMVTVPVELSGLFTRLAE
ncbi:alpha/beta hydrolase [Chitinophaga tropicalis]|uniref:Alpha/beta fold hydrolase n=1 Tax=Chitinophaga tropicalis TaxID=2683588 RepID=A0A7K1TX85_9BACT|nr:alpha/beta fold hydrolase [Chitinophaga tropicalis]MVT06721.1 alpha/beta fold hydrolase [Chitinophaga tropicalis]